MAGRNPNQGKCPGCRGYVKKDAEKCARCGMDLSPGGDNGSYKTAAAGKKGGKKEGSKAKDPAGKDAGPGNSGSDGAGDGGAASGRRRGFFGWGK